MSAMINTDFKHRTRLFAVMFLMLIPLVLVILRLCELQLQPQSHYELYAEVQNQTYVSMYPLRGTILSRDMTALATSYRVNAIFAETGDLAKVSVTCASLSPLIGLSPEECEKRIRTTFAGEAVVATGVDEKGREAVIAKEIPGVSVRSGEGGFNVVADLAKIDDIRSVSIALGRALRRRSEVFDKPMRDAAKGHVLLAQGIGHEMRRRIRELSLPGISYESVSVRAYPKGEFACHLLGFVGKDGKGLEGLERSEDNRLQGIQAYFDARRDRRGRRIITDDYTQFLPNGPDIVLTIDEYLQTVAETLLAADVRKFDARGGMLIAMDPHNGEILAMAVNPVYNPNEFQRYGGQYLNRAVSAVMEPGSVMKTITMALALEAGVVRPDTVIHCENGSYVIGGRVINDDKHSFGDLTCTDIIVRSSNIGATKVAQLMGADVFHAGLVKFGFGKRTGVDLPAEVPGLFTPLKDWSGSSIATVSYGQGGNSMTALQLIRSYAVLANGGKLVTPHVVMADRNPVDGSLHHREFEAKQILDASAAEEVKRMMVLVTEDKQGTGANARVPGYHVAGKTGTARVPRTDGPGYAYGRRLASFAGFLPAENPRLVIIAVVEEPRRAHYGGAVAAPLFRNFADRAMRYLDVPRSLPVEAENLAAVELPLATPTTILNRDLALVTEPIQSLPVMTVRSEIEEAPEPEETDETEREPENETVAERSEPARAPDYSALSPEQFEELIQSRRLAPLTGAGDWARERS